MATLLFHEFKKQASLFFKEKFKSARLALTDVTPAELKTKEVTNEKSLAPDYPTLKFISRAAFEIDDYWRIVEILHKRFLKFDKKNWRASYNSLIVLEHLLTHGPASSAGEFQCDKDLIRQMMDFQHTDDKTGFNWGLTVSLKAERVLKLLEDGTLRNEERNRVRKLSRGIQGFGSLCQRSTPKQECLSQESLQTTFDRCNSDFSEIKNENKENQSSCSNNCLDTTEIISLSSGHEYGTFKSLDSVKTESYQDFQGDNQMLHKSKTSSKSNTFLDGGQEDIRLRTSIPKDDHPFNSTEIHVSSSIPSSKMKQV